MLSIDVEDFFQVENYAPEIATSTWDSFTGRVEANTDRILAILEKNATKATFFILGWIAERYPGLIRRIHGQGHEIACHSHLHRLVYDMSPENFRQDAIRSKGVLEDIIGERVLGYRAPSFSITKKSYWALGILAELGFKYDSSIFPVLHDRYGISGSGRFPYKVALDGSGSIWEFPVSTVGWHGLTLPLGGGYFRAFPYPLTRWAFTKINEEENEPFLFYLHPWEIDPEQPAVRGVPFLRRTRHTMNLDKTMKRFEKLLMDFRFQPIHVNFREIS